MGLFSKKPRPAKTVAKLNGDAQSTTSFNSDNDTLKSPTSIHTSRMGGNRSSGGSSMPPTPLTPFSPMIPRVDLPKPPDPNLDPAAYLRSLGSVRERSRIIHDKAMRNKLHHFDVDMNRFPDVVRFVCGIIKVSGSVQCAVRKQCSNAIPIPIPIPTYWLYIQRQQIRIHAIRCDAIPVSTPQ